jgi:hypothetical protein
LFASSSSTTIVHAVAPATLIGIKGLRTLAAAFDRSANG